MFVFFLQSLILLIISLFPSTCMQARHLYNYGGDYIYADSAISPNNFTVCNKMAIDLMMRSVLVLFLVFIFYWIMHSCVVHTVYRFTRHYTQMERKWYYPLYCHLLNPMFRRYTNFANQVCGFVVGGWNTHIWCFFFD